MININGQPSIIDNNYYYFVKYAQSIYTIHQSSNSDRKFPLSVTLVS